MPMVGAVSAADNWLMFSVEEVEGHLAVLSVVA